MWPFRRRKPPRVERVRLEELAHDPEDNTDDYPVRSVGQSRLTPSFAAIGFTDTSQPRHLWALLEPIVDPRMDSVADVTISVEGVVVGYLRPPDLRRAIELFDHHHALSLEVPCLLVWSPAGPEVNIRLDPPARLSP